jgi:hypothetical protein
VTLSPQSYIDAIKSILNSSPIIQEWTIVDEKSFSDRGHFRVRFLLNTGDFVEASEFFVLRDTGIEQHRYRYQWMDSTKTQLKRRWDNAPHFPEVPNFPHHVHIGQEDRVFPSIRMGIIELISTLEQLILTNCR